jgi:hypothetical protein
MSRLWDDLRTAIDAGLELVNFATAPVDMRTVAGRCFGVAFPEATDREPVAYDMRTRPAAAFGGRPPYLLDAASEIDAIARWVAQERSGAGAAP